MIGEDVDIDGDGDWDVVDYLILDEMVSGSEETSGNSGCFTMVILCVLSGKSGKIQKFSFGWISPQGGELN